MRLATIKLAGFKSFVDPTTLHLPTNMTGIVGPNGCGKSNIIDAVRWVMGESSASRLRGDNATDVIFSGSNARKPVGQASVELIFDNSDHTVTGEFAAFNEISVKRTVGRDGQSSYALNGARCRRRDITDLFLGTGLGPRSYSIIEQGMISQIIEARPEDLRVYLEEAAGISKYKERRKDTETRIRHTRENLERLSDLREEVGKQLVHLARQARQAEQYNQLQAQRRQDEAWLRALSWRALDTQLGEHRAALASEETRLAQLVAGQREAETKLATGRAERDAAADAQARAQAAVFEAGAAVVRIEQQIQHQRDLAERLGRAREEAARALTELTGHISGDAEKAAVLRIAVQEGEPALEAARAEDDAAQSALREAEGVVASLQQRWDAHTRQQADAARAGDVERTRVEYLDRQVLDAQRRREKLDAERAALDLAGLNAAFDAARDSHDTHALSLHALNEELEAHKTHVAQLQERQRGVQAQLTELRRSLQTDRGRLASLETLQHAALGQEKGAAQGWLGAQGLADARRVGEALQVEAGWEHAVEIALGRLIEGVLVDDVDGLVPALTELAEGRLALVEDAAGSAVFPATSLAARVEGPLAVRRALAVVHAVESLPEAQPLLAVLPDGHWAITRDGTRLGHGWLRIERSGAAAQGALLREREIQTLRATIEQAQAKERALDEAQASLRAEALAAEQAREDAQRSLYHAHRTVSELAGRVQSHEGRLEQASQRLASIEAELAQLTVAAQEASAGSATARAALESAVQRMAELEDARLPLDAERRAAAEHCDSARQAARDAREALHARQMTLQSQRSQLDALGQALSRMDSQRGQLDSRMAELEQQLRDGDTPIVQLEQERQAALANRLTVDQALTAARARLEAIDAALREDEQVRQQREAQAGTQREAIAQRRLEAQALEMRAAQLSTAISEAGLELDAVLTAIDSADEVPPVAGLERSVAELEQKMRRLEPVNLAAIAEHAEAQTRKQYLDAQDADLNTALETLEEAIRRIDRETRGRFKDTFDRVNAGVQELYPRLFGGGHAYLELTGQDLLDAGVSIMARPPGKRVSSISLLSGGEKAMTAVALVFAIFRLNPAPFCLLDEVDAPLDEANVGRLADMVKEMSETVQFLFVTHNKATMEAAEQMLGVTMREAGVSRMVSVDLTEATRLAGAA